MFMQILVKMLYLIRTKVAQILKLIMSLVIKIKIRTHHLHVRHSNARNTIHKLIVDKLRLANCNTQTFVFTIIIHVLLSDALI